MFKLFKTNIGRLRLLGYVEGISLLLLIGVAVPLKYALHNPAFTRIPGSVHGALFLLFIFNTISAAIEYRWKASLIFKIMIACIIPFGTFYTDHKILKNIKPADAAAR